MSGTMWDVWWGGESHKHISLRNFRTLAIENKTLKASSGGGGDEKRGKNKSHTKKHESEYTRYLSIKAILISGP